jgi:hypothetical protein
MSWKEIFGIPESQPDLPKVDPISLVVDPQKDLPQAAAEPETVAGLEEMAAPLPAAVERGAGASNSFAGNPRNAGSQDWRSISLKATSKTLPPSHIRRR